MFIAAGFARAQILRRARVELPGYYRPTKKWDIVVVSAQRLIAAIELKSQVGPSFGNNFNNRIEEAIGNAVDVWRAYEEGTFGSVRPWLGYVLYDAACFVTSTRDQTATSTNPTRICRFRPSPQLSQAARLTSKHSTVNRCGRDLRRSRPARDVAGHQHHHHAGNRQWPDQRADRRPSTQRDRHDAIRVGSGHPDQTTHRRWYLDDGSTATDLIRRRVISPAELAELLAVVNVTRMTTRAGRAGAVACVAGSRPR